MKPMLLLLAGMIILGCNSKKETSSDTVATEKAADTSTVIFPQKMGYDAYPAVGNPENVVIVMNFNADFVAGRLDNIASYFADSVHGTFADGSQMHNVRDSVVASIKAWRNSMTSAEQTYISALAVDNKKNGDQWVFQWIDETHNYKDGKKEHLIYHEDYRLVNGKIAQFEQFAQGVAEKK